MTIKRLRPQRAQELTPERIFAEWWDEYNRAEPAVDFGYTAAELILNTQRLYHCPPGARPPIDPVSERDLQVMQATIQWLGTKCGVCFLAEAERRIDEARRREIVEFNERWNRPHEESVKTGKAA